MEWPYSAAIVHELVRAQKCPAPSSKIQFENEGEHGKHLSVLLELLDGGAYHLRLVVSAGRVSLPESYEAALLLNNRRIRGIGFSKIERKKRYKTYIPKGWHENVIDYNLPTTDDNHNRHDSLPDLHVFDLQDFLKHACQRWNIQLDFGQELW